MNWKQHLFKPKWQNKNADIRLESVRTEQHPDLIASLVDIAGNDDDARVRCAAIRRLHQLENILKLYGTESDSDVRTLLEERIHQLAASSNESRPALKFRMQVVESTTDRDLIEHLAGHAPEVELRRAALAKVERQGVLGDCCIQDSDAENRKFAASRITQHTTLKRVIEVLRKRDKALHGALQARLHQELLDQGDRAAVEIEALHICTALEKLALDQESHDKTEAESLYVSWKRISASTSEPLNDRYQRVYQRLTTPVVSAPVVIEPEAAPAPVEDKPSPPQAAEPPSTQIAEVLQANESLIRLLSQINQYQTENMEHPQAAQLTRFKNQLEKAWKSCTPPHADDLANWTAVNAVINDMQGKIESQNEINEKDLERAQELLKQLETELEQGELHKALKTRSELQQSAKGHGRDRDWKNINSKMSGMQARLRELRDWHHWSNNKIRKRLIAEMEVLPAADLHPDALLDRVKSLQAEWKTLEISEQIPGDKKFMAAPWMWRKFSAAGHKAFDTAKPYLDKRSEIQSRQVQSLATFCAELEQLAKAEPTDFSALSKGLTRGRKKLRDLNDLPANQRQKIARKLKASLDKANGVVQNHYETVEKEKMKLIRAASQLIHMPERSEAIAMAKSLQSNWRDAGSLWRSKEQELWNQFREHLDPLFTELKEQQASIRTAENDRLAAQKALCTELNDILKTEADLSTVHGKVQGLQDNWKDIQHPDRKLLASFQDMMATYQQRVEKAQQQDIIENRQRWWLKSALLHQLAVTGRTAKGELSKKTAASVAKAWPEDSSDELLETDMDQAYRQILAGEATNPDADEIEGMRDAARMLCIGLEFVAGLPSPDEDRDRRMKYQVDRLAESMSGENIRRPATDEARDTEVAWLGMYVLPEADFKAFGERVKLALTKIIENI